MHSFNDLQSLFPELETPFQYPADSLAAKPRVPELEPEDLSAFVPDSMLKEVTIKKVKTHYYPLGRLQSESRQHFLLLKAVNPRIRAVYLCVFDKKGRFSDARIIGRSDPKIRQGFRIDQKLLLYLNISKPGSARNPGEDVYMVNPDGTFTLILTNNAQSLTADQINPIDTLPRKHKYSADYLLGKTGLVSIRDGADAKSFRFFIYFNKNGDCKGEISGTGHFVRPGLGEFKEEDGPCGLRFTFSASRVGLKEIGGCGAYRDIRCFFDGTFTKKK
ncbi:hypothetical protein GCM10023143_33300 [Compostibacter hankyongensis]|uniref:Uncharacterized protein n=1 Tax=Compostibacter hankyongensis TaxID=1007089 RepID=A0ABP8G9E9_9BACT